MQPALRVENDQRDAVAKFLDYGCGNDRPKARGIGRDDQKGKLPRNPSADETVIKSRMGNRWRILRADEIEHEIKRSEDQKSPNSGDPENSLSEFHGWNFRRRCADAGEFEWARACSGAVSLFAADR